MSTTFLKQHTLSVYSNPRSANGFTHWLRTSTASVYNNLVCLSERTLRSGLSSGSTKILTTPNAGGNSLWSEVLSFEVLSGCFGVQLLRTEMELQYVSSNGPITDYSVVAMDNGTPVVLGVSVTRAMKFKGNYEDSDAERLLYKKLRGVVGSTQSVAPHHKWDKQILHVWAQGQHVADTLGRVYANMPDELKSNTLVVVSVVQGSLVWKNQPKL